MSSDVYTLPPNLPVPENDGAAGRLARLELPNLVAEGGRIVKVFYPVFPPDMHPADVLAWVEANPQRRD